MSFNADHLGAYQRGQEQFMKRLPIIRHIWALMRVVSATWRMVFIWHIGFDEAMEHPLFRDEIAQTKEIWKGRG